MEHYVSLIFLATGVFVATNIDDVFILFGLFADSKFKSREVMLGQYLGIAVLYAVSVVASLIALVISPAYVGLLGLMPIYIGAKKLWDLRNGGAEDEEESDGGTNAWTRYGNVVAVSSITIANGGDNISLYTPWFASKSGFDIAVIGVVFAMMTMIWIGAAHWMTNHQTIGAPIRRWGDRLVPYVLIALGFLVLHEAGSFALLR